MAFLNDLTLDNGLSSVKSNADKIYTCSQEPSTYTGATSTYALGNKNFGAGNVYPAAIAAGSPSGRKITTAAITDGSVTGTGTASHYAVVTSGSSRPDGDPSLSARPAATHR